MNNFLQVTDISNIKIGDTVVFRDGSTDVVVGIGFFGDPVVRISIEFQGTASLVDDAEDPFLESYRPDGINTGDINRDIVAIGE